jgi:kynurenine formamidase
MRTPAGFKKDMQFEMEVLKEHDAPGGAGQIVRGVHMRLHAGSHVDAPEHNVRGGTQIHQLPLELFMGDAIVADLRDKLPSKAITEKDLEKRLDNRIRKGDRLLLRTDHNNTYDGGSETWMKESPYLTIGATLWCIEKGVVIVGYDFYHGNDEPDVDGLIALPGARIAAYERTAGARARLMEKERFRSPIGVRGAAQASPVRAVECIAESAVVPVHGGYAMTAEACRVPLAAACFADRRAPGRVSVRLVDVTPIAGTAIDIMARLYADKLSKQFGQQVVVANRAGAAGMIGAQAVANAPADGYTVLFANSGHAILGAINKNLTFDPIADFAGVLLAGEAPGIVVVSPALGVSGLEGLRRSPRRSPARSTTAPPASAPRRISPGPISRSRPASTSSMCRTRSARRSSPTCSAAASRPHSCRWPSCFRCCRTAGCARSPSGRRSRCPVRSRSQARCPRASIMNMAPGTACWPRPDAEAHGHRRR